ncbi:MAG: FtsW/RodA/SpoVE family cell cycle protein [bacterium]
MLSRSLPESNKAESTGAGSNGQSSALANPLVMRIAVCTVLLAVLGILITTDATVGTARYGTIAAKQLALLPLAAAAFALGYWVRPKGWKTLATAMMALGLILLGVVLFPGLAHTSRGASRWINLGGFTFHPMEYFKFAFIIFSAHMLSSIKANALTPSQGLSRLLLVFFLGAGLIALEPDVDAIIILVFMLVGMSLASGAFSFKTLMKLALAGIVVMGLFVVAAMNLRGTSWGSALSKDKYDVEQAKYAIASGGLAKLAPGSSVQKYYIPEPHNDFAFAILAEELGAVGAGLLILLYLGLVFAGLEISRRFHDQTFESTLAMGISLIVGAQVFLNMGVATGLIPVAGLPLPLVSYGFTAMFMNMFEFGILARLAHETVRMPVRRPQAVVASITTPRAASPPPPPLVTPAGTRASFFSSLPPRGPNRRG